MRSIFLTCRNSRIQILPWLDNRAFLLAWKFLGRLNILLLLSSSWFLIRRLSIHCRLFSLFLLQRTENQVRYE